MSEQIVMLELPTKWDMTTDEDRKNAELMGKNPEDVEKIEDGFMYVNVSQIAAINESDIPENSVIRMNGSSYRINLTLKDLKSILLSHGVMFESYR